MAITVKHKFVSTIPDDPDTTLIRPSNWNDTHDLVGTVPVANGGTGAATLTGYVYGNGTSAMTASTTIPSGSVSGLGTMATQNASSVTITGGTLNGVAIGGTTAGDGSFDVLSSNAGNLNGTIGSTSPNTGAFTYISTSSTTSTTPTLSFNGSNCNIASGAVVTGSYLQNILQNTSATASASTNYVLSNDLGTDSTYYGEFGMNSSVYSSGTPADFFSINNGIYFSGHDGDLSVGSGNGKKLYLAWGTAGQSAHVINATGAIGLNTNITGTTNFGTSGQVLTSAGSAATPTWTTPTTGTVTSVAATVPAFLSVTGSPITSSGTLAIAYSGTALPVANGGTGATTLTGLVIGNGTSAMTTVTAPSGTVVGTSDTQTLTNKRINPRISSTTSTATLTVNSDSFDQVVLTAQAVALSVAAPTGTPVNGQKLTLRFKDNATAQTISWTITSGGFRVIGCTLPTTTVISKTIYIGCIYNSDDTFWDVVSVAQQI